MSILTVVGVIVILPRVVIAIHRTDTVLCLLISIFLYNIVWGVVIHLDSIDNLAITGISVSSML